MGVQAYLGWLPSHGWSPLIRFAGTVVEVEFDLDGPADEEDDDDVGAGGSASPKIALRRRDFGDSSGVGIRAGRDEVGAGADEDSSSEIAVSTAEALKGARGADEAAFAVL